MTQAHSLGPWKFQEHGIGTVYDATDCFVAVAFPVTGPVMEANAIIAAAPDLLDALLNAERTLQKFAETYNEQTAQADPLKNWDFDKFQHLMANAYTDAAEARQAIIKAISGAV